MTARDRPLRSDGPVPAGQWSTTALSYSSAHEPDRPQRRLTQMEAMDRRQAAGVVMGRVRAVLTGEVAPLGPNGVPSGINKMPQEGPWPVDLGGLAGDAQGDRRVHGGPDKAIHCYAFGHYTSWAAEIGPHPLLVRPGAFGENLSLDDLDEGDVCLGDRWRIGSTLLEITQGRQPCYKLNLRFGLPDMARRVQDSLRAGWYLRVLEGGTVRAGDVVELRARPYPSHTVADLLALIRDRVTAPERLMPVLELPLPPSWRRLFGRRVERGRVEDWDARLAGD